jgi:hypothetical protein
MEAQIGYGLGYFFVPRRILISYFKLAMSKQYII